MADFWSQFQQAGPLAGQGLTAAAQTLSGANPQAAQSFIQTHPLPNGSMLASGAQQAGSVMTGQPNDFNLGGFQPAPPGAPNDPRLTTQPQPSQQGPGGTMLPPAIAMGPNGPIDPGTGQPYQQGPGGTSAPRGDPKSIALAYAQSLGPPSAENIQKVADHMKSLGYNVQANPGSDGFFINGVGVDMVSNFHGQGAQNWQYLPDGPGAGGNPNDPSGFQTGSFTGGGQYPLASVNGTGLAAPWLTPFQAPDNLTEQNDPGFQARMKMGTDAIQRSAASRGTLLTGGLLKGLDRYAQDYASNEYGNVYNRALGQYQQAYGIFNNNQSNLFNRLSSLGSVGENAAAGVGNAQIGLGNSQAQGSIAQGNIWGNAINNGVNAGLQYMNQQYNNPQYAANASGYNPNGVNGYGVTMIPSQQG